jgi:hypothetical protein
MSQVFSEINKINNVFVPRTGCSGEDAVWGTAAAETDIVNMKLYKHCTFVVSLGTPVAATHFNIKVMAAPAATSSGSCTPIEFKYRTQGSTHTANYTTGSDIPSALTAGTTDGIDSTTDYASGLLILEVDPCTVAAAGSSGGDFDHVKLWIVSSTGADAPRGIGVLAILSEPRYPQAILATAID